MNEKAKAIKVACDVAIKRWIPDGENTFCNAGVNAISSAAGYNGFRSLIANEIIALLKKSPDFARVSADDAKKLADDGRLVIAGRTDEPHGHVAVVYPGGPVVNSGHWHELAATVANVGRINGVMGANYAFSLPPAYWSWIETA